MSSKIGLAVAMGLGMGMLLWQKVAGRKRTGLLSDEEKNADLNDKCESSAAGERRVTGTFPALVACSRSSFHPRFCSLFSRC
jgi:hypothetical protein